MSDLHIRDISKYQHGADVAGYVKAGNPALIIRAHNGVAAGRMRLGFDHTTMPRRASIVGGVDPSFASFRKAAHAAGVTELGLYQYLVADRAVADQAADYLAAVGTFAPNEFPVLDLEEGSGSQLGRARAWFDIVEPHAHGPGVLYTGLAYLPGSGLLSEMKARPSIIAAYRTAPEPPQSTAPHTLWQHSNGTTPPHADAHLGAVDCSIFHGSIAELTALLHPEANVALTADDIDKVATAAVSKLLAKPISDPLNPGKTVTVMQLLSSVRSQVNGLAHAEIDADALAAEIAAKLPGVTAEQMTTVLKDAFASLGS